MRLKIDHNHTNVVRRLAHERLVRQSTDNVCVIVVDLEAHGSSGGG